MFDFDRSNFISYLTNFPKQIKSSYKPLKDFSPSIKTSEIQNIVIAGMGGSAIAGDLFLGYIQEELNIPALVCRNYSIPAFVNDHTLFIAISYSGDTEETISAIKEATERSAKIIGIASGGKLKNLCSENSFPFLKVPGGLPPRQALGYLYFPLMVIFEKLGLITARKDEVSETIDLLHELVERYNPETSLGNNLPNHIAQSIYYAIPIIYTGVPFLYPVPVRWRNQFNENSKSSAFSNIFPELNHNEIMAYEGISEVNKHLRLILLRDREESPRVNQRITITKDILKEKKILFGEMFSEGSSRLARLFSLIFMGDWASYYLAMLNEKDPITIDSIDHLKEKLSGSDVRV